MHQGPNYACRGLANERCFFQWAGPGRQKRNEFPMGQAGLRKENCVFQRAEPKNRKTNNIAGQSGATK